MRGEYGVAAIELPASKCPPDSCSTFFQFLLHENNKRSTSLRMCFYFLAEQEGFELALRLTIIRNN